jgi:hypothetical protein
MRDVQDRAAALLESLDRKVLERRFAEVGGVAFDPDEVETGRVPQRVDTMPGAAWMKVTPVFDCKLDFAKNLSSSRMNLMPFPCAQFTVITFPLSFCLSPW